MPDMHPTAPRNESGRCKHTTGDSHGTLAEDQHKQHIDAPKHSHERHQWYPVWHSQRGSAGRFAAATRGARVATGGDASTRAKMIQPMEHHRVSPEHLHRTSAWVRNGFGRASEDRRNASACCTPRIRGQVGAWSMIRRSQAEHMATAAVVHAILK